MGFPSPLGQGMAREGEVGNGANDRLAGTSGARAGLLPRLDPVRAAAHAYRWGAGHPMMPRGLS